MSDNEKPLVTFALFAYNQEQFIREAVEGAFAQTYEPLEIILSDDCSTDRTFDIMQEMAAGYEGPHEVRVRRNQRNFGLACHINAIVEMANGAIICWAAGDDISLPFRTELLADPIIKNMKTIGVHSTVREMDLSGKLGDVRQHAEHVRNLSLDSVVNFGGGVVSQAHAFRKVVFDRFGPLQAYLTNEGPAMAFRECLLGDVVYIPIPTVLYRVGCGVSTYSGKNAKLLKSLEPIKYSKWRLTAVQQMLEDLQKVSSSNDELMTKLLKRESYYNNLLNINSGDRPLKSLFSNILLVGFDSASVRAFIRLVCPRFIYSLIISSRTPKKLKNSYASTQGQNMKHWIPKSIRRPIGNVRSAMRRFRVWLHVKAMLTGVTPIDSKVLQSAIRRSPRTIWQNLDQWQFPMVADNCSVTSKGIGSFQVRAFTDDLFHVLPMQEPAVETAIRAILQPGDTFVDAGANIGFYTILASQLVGPKGRVISFEMIPETAEILRAHVAKNNCHNARVVEGALASTSGLIIKANIMVGKSGQASIARSVGNEEIEVRSVTLAEELKDITEVHLVKMDLEGAELEALKGLGDEIKKVRAIIFENRGAVDVVEYLKAQGYHVVRLDGNNALAQRSRPN